MVYRSAQREVAALLSFWESVMRKIERNDITTLQLRYRAMSVCAYSVLVRIWPTAIVLRTPSQCMDLVSHF